MSAPYCILCGFIIRHFPSSICAAILQVPLSIKLRLWTSKAHLKTMFVCELMFLPPYMVVIQEGLGLTCHWLKQSSENFFKFHC